jgi:transcriptional regulator with XRE-family HTH domain
MINIADNLRRKLNEALSAHGAIGAFCKKTGVSRGTAENWRDGKTVPSVDQLGIIAEALGTTPQTLLGFDLPGEPRPALSPELLKEQKEQMEAFRQELLRILQLPEETVELLKMPIGILRLAATLATLPKEMRNQIDAFVSDQIGQALQASRRNQKQSG